MNSIHNKYRPDSKELKLIIDLIINKSAIIFEDISWLQFNNLVFEHRLIQTIYPTISQYSEIPFQYLHELKAHYAQSKYQLLNFASQSVEISNALKAKGIDCLFFKGVIQAYRYSGDFTSRHCKDIDVLVKAEDFEKAQSIIIAHNYQISNNIGYTPKQIANYKKYIYHCEFYNPETNTQIELHWRLHNSAVLTKSETSFWSNAETLVMGNAEIKVLSNVDNFIQLILHGTQHHFWFRLHWIHDIYKILLVEKEEFIHEVIDKAKELKLEKPVLASILLLETIFDIKIDFSKKTGYNDNSNFREIVKIFILNIENTGKKLSAKENIFMQLKNYWVLKKLGSWGGVKNELMFNLNNPKNWEVFYFPDKFYLINFIMAPFIWIYRKFRK